MVQQGLVKQVADHKPAARGGTPADQPTSLTLARPELKAEAPDVPGQMVVTAVRRGGLRAGSHQRQGRLAAVCRPRSIHKRLSPMPFSAEPGSDVPAVDMARNDLLRLEGSSGRIRWRQSIGEPFDAYPVIAGENVLVATRSGKLITIAAATGEWLGYVQVPQSLRAAPVVDPHLVLVYQVADHTNVFITSLADHTCKNVAYLEHEPGTVLTTPVVVDDFLLVAINSGAHDATLNVFLIQPPKAGKPESWLKPVQQVEASGHVQTPPYLDGRRLLVVTSNGSVRIFQIGATGEKTPLHPLADAIADGGENLVRFHLLQGGQFWIADNRLTKYDVQAARGRLVPSSVEGQDSVYLQPPLAVGPSVVTVRRKIGLPGAVVCAMPMQPQDAERQEGGLDHFWETELAAPLAAEPLLARDGNLFAVTARGTVFKIEPAQLAKGVLSQPTAVPSPILFPAPVRHVAPLPGGRLAISSGKGSKQVGIYDPFNAPTKVSALNVPDGHELACARWRSTAACSWPTVPGRCRCWTPRRATRWPSGSSRRWNRARQSIGRSPPWSRASRRSCWLTASRRSTGWGSTTSCRPTSSSSPRPRSPRRLSRPWPCWATRSTPATPARCLRRLACRSLPAARSGCWTASARWARSASATACCCRTDDGQLLLCLDARGRLLWQTALPLRPVGRFALAAGTQLPAGRALRRHLAHRRRHRKTNPKDRDRSSLGHRAGRPGPGLARRRT